MKNYKKITQIISQFNFESPRLKKALKNFGIKKEDLIQ